ncbi:MAG: DmsE family decaheme c-type cytochrome [Desulfobacteraceae bacterium]|nr:DmsE family decaheme c-type cytochrome [Desulfobacteraceae bacterium]MBC2755076.1 DmsE family decaheme c-type cytochrome [Desulfobacteraceae bacterium]
MKKSVLFCRLVMIIILIGIMPDDGRSDEQPDYIGTETCLSCHDDMIKAFDRSVHSKALLSNDKYSEKQCEACHGPGSEHMVTPEASTIITFGSQSPSQKAQNNRCLSCHASSQHVAMWETDLHAKQDVSCIACHPVHKDARPIAPMPETCYSCHLDIKIDANKQSRHPIREGKVECQDCHNPHGTLTDDMLRADFLNELCYRCHAEKRGPFMWEHPPVEENCGTCHKSHGSNHKKLLNQKVPNLCQGCHFSSHINSTALDRNSSFNGSKPSNKFYGRSCLNCHPNVHGSWSPTRRGKRLIY